MYKCTSTGFLRSRCIFGGERRSFVNHFSAVSEDYDYHFPVMINECCEMLNIQHGKVYVDCTLGGGGHTKAILERGGFVIGIDQDPDAIARSSAVLKEYIDKKSCELICTNFRNIKGAIAGSQLAGKTTEKKGVVDGVLMDLGVSSYQINEASRGFAFGQDGPLDMRMNKGEKLIGVGELPNGSLSSSFSAYDIINTWDCSDLADVFYIYGDEVRSRVLAREIVSARPLSTTGQLERIISSKTAFEHRPKTLARCFQALRIVVNDEMGALEDALSDMQHCIRHGGRFLVMSYHSLEDRKVKNLFRTGNIEGRERHTDRAPHRRGDNGFVSSGFVSSGDSTCFSNSDETGEAVVLGNPWEVVTRRAVTPSAAEIDINRRARSAKLRVATQVLLHKEEKMVERYQGHPTTGPKIGAKQLAKMEKRKNLRNRKS